MTRACVALVIGFALSSPLSYAQAEIFARAHVAGSASQYLDPSAARRTDLHVDLAAIRSLAASHRLPIVIPVPTDDPVEVTFDEVRPVDANSWDLIGKVTGEPWSRALMVVRGDRVVMTVASLLHHPVVVQPAPSGGYVLTQFDAGDAALRSCAANSASESSSSFDTSAPILQKHRGLDDQNRRIEDDSPLVDGASPCPSSISSLSGYVADDGSMCDVIVYYTASALATAGSVANMNALIDMAILDANTKFSDSGVSTQVRVVHRAQIAYTENVDTVLNLVRLATPGDGMMDQVFADRDTHGGDLVTVFMNNTLNSGGAGFFPWALWPEDNGESGFSVLRLNNALLGTLAHEFGHNFGCAHNRPNDPPGSGWYPYSHGYVEPGGAWQTIMANSAVPYVPYFSNPSLNYAGPLGNPGPLGVAGTDPNTASDCVRTINENAFTVANFRPSKLAAAPSSSRLYVRANAAPGGNGSSWATALQSVQDAIGVAVRARGSIDEVWVAAGTYSPDVGIDSRAQHFRPVEGVTIYGGFAGNETSLAQRNLVAHPTILSGDLGMPGDTADNAHHVVRADNLGQTAVLDGFIIRDGNADAPFPHNIGGGARVRCGGPQFDFCTFEMNLAQAGGGAAYFDEGVGRGESCRFMSNTATQFGGGGLRLEPGATGKWHDCIFQMNQAAYGGGFSCSGAFAVQFVGCTFENNSAPFGGGIDIFESDVALAGSTVRANQAPGGTAGGIACNTGGDLFLYYCLVEDNTAGFGAAGVGVFNGNLEAINADFVGNSGNFGAGLWFDNHATGSLEGCGFFGNQSVFIGAGVHCSLNSDPAFINCVFSGNACTNSVGGAIGNTGGSDPILTNCTLANNAATFGGPAIWDENGGTTLRNCIVWSHANPAIAGMNPTTVATYSDIQGGFAGVGNKNSNPLFGD
ncbi:MAG: M12 family metallo-peptidase, partial [Phycisphaerae bacterium]